MRGGSPGTRDTDALNPLCNQKEVHAVVLSGRSSFGLDAVGILAAHAAEAAIVDAVKSADSYGDYLSYKERIHQIKNFE